ncbi:MAG TPA: insulinase family protein, partial [Desulfobaccales bacterium]|nr:insulinase family protein [Desulfobaccales bacterium]
MAFKLPEIHQAALPGGMRLLGVEYDRVPWLSLTFMTKRGSETDPLEKPGVADWAAELLTLGTARRSQLQLAEDIESRGAALDARGGWDATLINLEGLAEDFPELMATLAEVVQSPGFPEDEFRLLKERRRAELVHQQDDPREMANVRYLRLFFGDSPYGHAVQGNLQHLDNLDLGDLKEFHRREFTPATATLVVVGMLPFARVQEEAA